MGSIIAHRRWLGPYTSTPATAGYRYPEGNLVAWGDTSLGGMVVDGNGKLTSLANQTGNGDFVAATPVDVVNDGTFPLITLQAGSLVAQLTSTYTSPVTVLMLVKMLPNSPNLDYQLLSRLYDTPSDNSSDLYIKFTTNVLVLDAPSTFYDLPNAHYPSDGYCFVALTSSVDGSSNGAVGITTAMGTYSEDQTQGQYFFNKVFSVVHSGTGNFGLKLYLVYNRILTPAEIMAARLTAEDRFKYML